MEEKNNKKWKCNTGAGGRRYWHRLCHKGDKLWQTETKQIIPSQKRKVRSLISTPACCSWWHSSLSSLPRIIWKLGKKGLMRFLMEISYLRMFHNENVVSWYGIPFKNNLQFFWMFKYPYLFVCMCVYIIISSELCFLLHTEKVFFSRTNHLCVVFSWQKVGLFIHYFYCIWKNQYICNIFSSYWSHNADRFTLFPSLVKVPVKNNVCKSNSDLRVNLKEFIKEIYSEKDWTTHLIQRQLMALLNPAIAVSVCVLSWNNVGALN